MARPCLVRIKSRAVLAKTGATETLDITNDRIAVMGLEVAVEATEIDRSDVYTPNGLGLGSVTSGRRTTFTITQEVYGDISEHLVLLEACPVKVTTTGDGNGYVEPSESVCEGTGYKPCTIEIIEVGGNKYRAENCTGTFTLTASPGDRQQLVFTMEGSFVQPDDSGVTTVSIVPVPLPLMYKNSTVEFTTATGVETPLGSCPAVTFTPGMESVVVPSACTPDGGGWSIVGGTGPASLAFSGVVSRKESVDKLWKTSVDPAEGAGATVVAVLFESGAESFSIEFDDFTLRDPALTEVEQFVGYDVNFEGADWVMTWAGFGQ